MDINIYIHISKNRGGNIYTAPLYLFRGGSLPLAPPYSDAPTYSC